MKEERANPESNDEITIEKLYPGLTKEERAEAEANLEAYVDIVYRIYQRTRSDHSR